MISPLIETAHAFDCRWPQGLFGERIIERV